MLKSIIDLNLNVVILLQFENVRFTAIVIIVIVRVNIRAWEDLRVCNTYISQAIYVLHKLFYYPSNNVCEATATSPSNVCSDEPRLYVYRAHEEMNKRSYTVVN